MLSISERCPVGLQGDWLTLGNTLTTGVHRLDRSPVPAEVDSGRAAIANTIAELVEVRILHRVAIQGLPLLRTPSTLAYQCARNWEMAG